MSAVPTAPIRRTPDDWTHCELWRRVCDAVRALPDYFKTETTIAGILGTDIFTLNAMLGATIEEQVVQSLNNLRAVWDPDRAYQTYAFVRQSQSFPDVILRRTVNGQDILMGIELKGWYLPAKEGMPNLRFTVTPAVCNPQDLLVVVPWALSNVVAGSPKVHAPFIESARFCAEQRNYYWQTERTSRSDKSITLSTAVTPYPRKSEAINDQPVTAATTSVDWPATAS